MDGFVLGPGGDGGARRRGGSPASQPGGLRGRPRASSSSRPGLVRPRKPVPRKDGALLNPGLGRRLSGCVGAAGTFHPAFAHGHRQLPQKTEGPNHMYFLGSLPIAPPSPPSFCLPGSRVYQARVGP